MRNTKHTPGPWRPDGDWIRSQQAPHRQGICKMLYIPVAHYEPELNRVVNANARLIAAAPEMYETLLIVCDTLREGAGQFSVDTLCDMIDAELKKARGEVSR